MRSRLCLYFLEETPKDRWFKGDHIIRRYIRRTFRGKDRISSLKMVFFNLIEGLKKVPVTFTVNMPFDELQQNDIVVILGSGKNCLKNYKKANPIIAGIGLMTHPSEWPGLFDEYPVKFYLQHSEWTSKIYQRYFKGKCRIWPVGIDTDNWKPSPIEKKIDFLIYSKFLWDKDHNESTILHPIINLLNKKSFTFVVIKYGSYNHNEYKKALAKSHAMIFLCEHESQGLAYQQALSTDVPVLAWEQGFWLDPQRFKWGEKDNVYATSVPYFSEDCGAKFSNLKEFEARIDHFYAQVKNGSYSPREYVLENLTLKKSAERLLDIVKSI